MPPISNWSLRPVIDLPASAVSPPSHSIFHASIQLILLKFRWLFLFTIIDVTVTVSSILNIHPKLNIQKTKIMASGPHHFMENRWGNSGNSVRLYFGGSKITADGDCSQEIKRCLLNGRKVMTNTESIFKSRDITLLSKVCLVKAMVFPVVMYGCESWTVKKAEH